MAAKFPIEIAWEVLEGFPRANPGDIAKLIPGAILGRTQEKSLVEPWRNLQKNYWLNPCESLCMYPWMNLWKIFYSIHAGIFEQIHQGKTGVPGEVFENKSELFPDNMSL